MQIQAHWTTIVQYCIYQLVMPIQHVRQETFKSCLEMLKIFRIQSMYATMELLPFLCPINSTRGPLALDLADGKHVTALSPLRFSLKSNIHNTNMYSI